ncbi:TlpA disulfide reductase family protein [Pedobacter deserti]|uniref:TlpA disulfide reductase family protein n=1 Tax=Pedobacter deserti TaxID=2817382 RepID=UPI0021096073|nr:TlpA disulfide reductase family protein [Pedobacter sp. SYSU D00382]
MNLTSIKTILALAILPIAGFSQGGNFSIEGQVSAKHNGKFVKLYYSENETKKIDSAAVQSGKFSLKGNVKSPTAAKIGFGDQDAGDNIDVFLSEGTIRLKAKDSIHYADIRGTKLAESHERLARQLRPADDKFVRGLITFRDMPKGPEKDAYLTSLMAGFDEYNLRKREIVHQFVSENPASYVSLYYLDKSAQGRIANYETTFPFYNKLSPELKATPLGKQLGERLMAAKGALTGEPYKDFVSTTPEGKQLSLKEIVSKNKYTLVDFWASWCGPCRKENPHVVKTFNAFREKGFTVLSVSLDDNADKWKEAIEKDGMPWYHVSSLKGWKEPAAALYNVRAIPQNVLVDSEGKIVATNLRAETLFNKVQQLLN